MSKHRNAENQSAQSYERQLRFGSMLRKLLPSGSRRWITPIVMLLLLLGIVAGAVIVSSVTQRHVQLDDGTVWVTSLKDRKAARFNVRNRDADAGVASTAARFDVAQHDGSTVISEGTKASSIEASTVSENGNTTIKSDTRTVVGGNTAAFINVKTGNVWVGSADDVKSMNPTTDSPKMKLGSGGRIAVTHDRTSDGAVLSVDGPQGTPGKDATIKGATNVESFTVVGKTPVVAGAGKVFWPKGSADIGLQGQATLQAPSPDGRQTGWVAVSTPRGVHQWLRVRRVGAEGQQLHQGVRGERQGRTVFLVGRCQSHLAARVPHQPSSGGAQRRGQRQCVESAGVHQGHQNPVEQGGDQAVEATAAKQRQRQQPAQFQQELFGAVGADQGRGRFVRRARGIAADSRRVAQRRADRLFRAAHHVGERSGWREHHRLPRV